MERGSDKGRRKQELIQVDKVAVALLLHLSDLSAFSPVSDSGFLLLRSLRTRATWAWYFIQQGEMKWASLTTYVSSLGRKRKPKDVLQYSRLEKVQEGR